MKHLKHLLHLIFALNLAFHSPNLIAQDSEMGLSKLSTEEEQKYQQILDTPVDVNSLNTTKINRYSEKAVAAIMLGNISKREEILLDWSKIDDEGKFNLRVFYSMMGRFEEAIKVTDQLLNSRDPRFIWNATRSRLLCMQVADYLAINQLDTRASVLKSSTSGQLLKKQVVVFATHGLLAGDLPNLSQPALAMAATANPADSPLLTLEDVLSLKLNADWVVLSACNTAGADGRAEEAMSGLARGFFFAGSRSLLVTHWSVESESAMQLTTNAFASYKKDTAMRRSEALRQSMLAVMKSPAFGHPAFWAPYALVGEGGR